MKSNEQQVRELRIRNLPKGKTKKVRTGTYHDEGGTGFLYGEDKTAVTIDFYLNLASKDLIEEIILKNLPDAEHINVEISQREVLYKGPYTDSSGNEI